MGIQPSKGKKVGNKPIAEKEMLLDDIPVAYLVTKEDNYGNDHMFFKVMNPNGVADVMKMDTRLPMWHGNDDDILMKVKTQNVNSVLELNKWQIYESIMNLERYSLTPEDKTELLEGFSAKIMKLKTITN